MHAQAFVATARFDYNVTIDNINRITAQVAEVIRQCSRYFRRRHTVLRECYDNGRYERGFLADPELRLVDETETEIAPAVRRPRAFKQGGVSFKYPRNWSVTEDVPGWGDTRVRNVFIESPGGAVAIVTYFKGGTGLPLEEFAGEFDRTLGASFKELPPFGPSSPFTATGSGDGWVRSVVAGVPRDGVEQAFSVWVVGKEIPHMLRAFKVETATADALVVVQAANDDWKVVAPGFTLILESLKIQ